MEINLFVLTHKPNFGSTMHFSSHLSDDEKVVLESMSYRKFEPDEEEIREVQHSGYYVYFITYVGGKDEYGREYRNVISALFPFQLTVSDGEKIRRIFTQVKNDLANPKFSLSEKYFARISKKNTFENRVNSLKDRVRLNAGNVIILLYIFHITLFFVIADRYFTSNRVVISDLIRYAKLKVSIGNEDEYLRKFHLQKNLIEFERKRLVEYQNRAENEEFSEIGRLEKEDPNNTIAILKQIDKYLDNSEFELFQAQLKDKRSRIVKKIDSVELDIIRYNVSVFNEKVSYDSLSRVITKSKNYIDVIRGSKKKEVRKILLRAQELEKGINVFLTLEITGSKSDLNDFKFILRTGKNKKFYEKDMDRNGNKFFAKYFGAFKLQDSYVMEIYKGDNLIHKSKVDTSELAKDNKSSISISGGYSLEVDLYTSDDIKLNFR